MPPLRSMGHVSCVPCCVSHDVGLLACRAGHRVPCAVTWGHSTPEVMHASGAKKQRGPGQACEQR
jgi:hypothetical protein